LGVPCITLRPETEWVETVHSGWNLLADPRDPEFADNVGDFAPAGPRPAIFGSHVAEKMTALLESFPSLVSSAGR
jgi:hypothetical protein